MIEIDCRRTDALRHFLRKRALARSAVANDYDLDPKIMVASCVYAATRCAAMI
jgi:hypothetical protein